MTISVCLRLLRGRPSPHSGQVVIPSPAVMQQLLASARAGPTAAGPEPEPEPEQEPGARLGGAPSLQRWTDLAQRAEQKGVEVPVQPAEELVARPPSV